MKADPNVFPAMPQEQIAQQPLPVWRCVEEAITHGYHFRAKDAHSLTHLGPPAPHDPGWLTMAHIEPLNALDVPVSRMFTGCAIAVRATPRPTTEGSQ